MEALRTALAASASQAEFCVCFGFRFFPLYAATAAATACSAVRLELAPRPCKVCPPQDPPHPHPQSPARCPAGGSHLPVSANRGAACQPYSDEIAKCT